MSSFCGSDNDENDYERGWRDGVQHYKALRDSQWGQCCCTNDGRIRCDWHVQEGAPKRVSDALLSRIEELQANLRDLADATGLPWSGVPSAAFLANVRRELARGRDAIQTLDALCEVCQERCRCVQQER